jgi:hypothetical protein
MWFLIRCAFWLSIVFTLLPWPEGSGFGSSPPAAIWSRTRDAIGEAIVKARAASEKICTDSPLECLKAAARLDQYATTDQRAEGAPAAGSAAKRSSAPGGDVKAPQAAQPKTASARNPSAGQLKAASSAPPPR